MKTLLAAVGLLLILYSIPAAAADCVLKINATSISDYNITYANKPINVNYEVWNAVSGIQTAQPYSQRIDLDKSTKCNTPCTLDGSLFTVGTHNLSILVEKAGCVAGAKTIVFKTIKEASNPPFPETSLLLVPLVALAGMLLLKHGGSGRK